eukprot:CAMPEP_0118913908 /NCGR_PEP_ID=MMETSP1166-20130328/14498_1 /TAXON_ID=1104430 /ORGANISM="Chrysoreinhardia sp, Strain CCMP3193" /LENGTH=644 /DNA_ID=CAMNT_0006853473 /DNA_START=91 /DNA_END=2025 /DNA_ORIENTATION=+
MRLSSVVVVVWWLRGAASAFSSSKKKKEAKKKESLLVFNPLSKLRADLCEFKAVEGPVQDCSCSFEDVDDATAQYFGPLLLEVTQRKFFKYFKVDLDGPCAFWPDDGQCDRFECAVDQECDELPEVWRVEDELRSEWRAAAQAEEDAAEEEESSSSSTTPTFLCDANIPVDRDHDMGKADYWSETGGDEVWIEQDETDMVYVDLIKNPEKFTGYDGEKARRIWRAVHEENCFSPPRPREFVLEAFRRFGGEDPSSSDDPSFDDDAAGREQCLERRVYYRLMSGLQASISTHIAKSDFSPYDVIFKFTKPADRLKIAVGILVEYLVFGSKIVKNDPVFVARVGAHPERIHNLYFTYLFVLRAVAKAKDYLVGYDYDTGDAEDDLRAKQLVAALVNSTGWEDDDRHNRNDGPEGTAALVAALLNKKNYTTTTAADDATTAARTTTKETDPKPRGAATDRDQDQDQDQDQEDDLGLCVAAARQAFDESALFRAPVASSMSPLEKALARESVEELRAEFLARFRNISRIMDCVTCERCRLWGKLQILGLGTALKILLMEGDESGIGTLQRNEVVALVNTLAQLAKSVDSIKDWQRRSRIRVFSVALIYACGAVLQAVLLSLISRRLFPGNNKKKENEKETTPAVQRPT